MDVACLVIPDLFVRIERQRRPELEDRSLLIVESGPGGRIVVQASADTEISPGIPLSQALARFPEAAILPVDYLHYQECWQRVLERLEQVSPAVEDGGFGCAYADIRQLEQIIRISSPVSCSPRRSSLKSRGDGSRARKKLSSPRTQLAERLLAAAPSEWAPRLGIGPAPFLAYLSASMAPPGTWLEVPEDLPTYLADVAVEALPLPWPTIDRLRSFGLATLGQIARMPIGALQAQFGAAGRLAWELANGIDRRVLLPRRPAVFVREQLDLPAPIATIEHLLIAVESLLGRAFNRVELRGRTARAAILEGDIAGSAPLTKRVTFREPVGSKERAFRVFKLLLTDIRLPGPIEQLSLTLAEISGEAGRQVSLLADVRQRDNLREALRELRVRFAGQATIYQIREVEPWSRIPERRRALVPYDI